MTESASREALLTNREPIQAYWKIRLERLRSRLEKNHFEAYVADSAAEAKRLVLENILPDTGARSVSWGGTMTMEEVGLGEALRKKANLTRIDPMEQGPAPNVEHLRKSLTVDLYFSGTNAVTEAGQLVNLDMLGNRIGAITFGPTHVVILVGRNKVVSGLEAAMDRIRNYVSPAHVKRVSELLGFDMETPCMKTASCHNCSSPMRICNAWSIIEKSYPQGRIKVILVNEDLGV